MAQWRASIDYPITGGDVNMELPPLTNPKSNVYCSDSFILIISYILNQPSEIPPFPHAVLPDLITTNFIYLQPRRATRNSSHYCVIVIVRDLKLEVSCQLTGIMEHLYQDKDYF